MRAEGGKSNHLAQKEHLLKGTARASTGLSSSLRHTHSGSQENNGDWGFAMIGRTPAKIIGHLEPSIARFISRFFLKTTAPDRAMDCAVLP